VLVTLRQAPGRERRVGDLVDSLGWEKSRVSHQLTCMENGGFVAQTEAGVSGRRYFLDSLTPDQATTIRAWSGQVIDRIEPRWGETADNGAASPRPTGL
jgi:DNA-binding MarR family transcriptional regulator